MKKAAPKKSPSNKKVANKHKKLTYAQAYEQVYYDERARQDKVFQDEISAAAAMDPAKDTAPINRKLKDWLALVASRAEILVENPKNKNK